MFFFFEIEKDSVPSFSEMMIPVLAALEELEGMAYIDELDKKTIELMTLTKEQINIPHGNSKTRTEVEYRLAWARTYLKKYGLISNPSRGKWELIIDTPINLENIDPKEIEKTVRMISDSDNKDSMTGVESYIAFEQFARNILIDEAKIHKKPFHIEPGGRTPQDIFFPQGILQITTPVICEIKYIASNKIGTLNFLYQQVTKRLAYVEQNETILLVVNVIVSENQKNELKLLSKKNENINVEIIDVKDLSNIVDPNSSSADYFISPKRALVEEALQSVDFIDYQAIKIDYIKQLKHAYTNDNLTLFLGAGVSIDAGVPLWSELIQKLLLSMIKNVTKDQNLNKIDIDTLTTFANSNKNSSPLTQVRYIKQGLPQKDYYKLISKSLYDGNVKVSLETNLLNVISCLCGPQIDRNGVRNIITYNFDDIIERKFFDKEIQYYLIYNAEHLSEASKLNIYHVHGFLPFNENIDYDKVDIIFSEEDYHKVYRDAFSWSNLVQLNAFRGNTCLFIGCSMTDPNLRRLLDVAARAEEPPRHFAFIKRTILEENNFTKKKTKLLSIYRKIDENIQEGYFRQSGVNIIWFDEYSEISDMLKQLLDQVKGNL